MKKTKLFSAFFAAVALASCSSDDLNVAGNSVQLKNDGTQLLVTVGEGDAMRSGYAQAITGETEYGAKINTQFVWTKGDQIKVYCEDTWKPQTYECVEDYSMATADVTDGAVFENVSSGDLKVETPIRQYGIYPYNENGMKVEFSDDERSSLKVTIPDEIQYKTDEYQYSSTVIEGVLEGDKNEIENRVFFKSLIPLFGYINNTENKLKFQYITAVLRVNLTGVVGDKLHTLTLESTANKLSGVFKAEGLEIYHPSMETAIDDYPRLLTENTTEKSSITVGFLPVEDQTDYTIYIPVPLGTYDGTKLSLKYNDGEKEMPLTLLRPQADAENNQGNYTDVKTAETLRLFRGISLIAEYNQAFEVEDIQIPGEDVPANDGFKKGLQTFLNSCVPGATHKIVINVNKNSRLPITVADNDNVNYHTLVLPKLDYDVTLNVYQFGTNGDVLTIKGGEGSTGKLILNTTFDTKVKVDAADVDVVLGNIETGSNTTFKRTSIEIANLKSLELGNVNFNMQSNIETVDFGSTPLSITGTVQNTTTVSGRIVQNIVTEADVEITGKLDIAKLEAANVTLKGEAKAIVANGDFTAVGGKVAWDYYGTNSVTVAGNAIISGETELGGPVTVAGNTTVTDSDIDNLLTVGGTLSIKDSNIRKQATGWKPGAIVMTGAKTATIDNAEDKEKLAIATLTFEKKGSLVLRNGVVNEIILVEDAKGANATSVASSGYSAIGKITGPVGNVTSTWTSKVTHPVEEDLLFTTNSEYSIYTVSQLLAIPEQKTTNKKVNIYADNINFNNSEWDGLTASGSTFTLASTANYTGKSIIQKVKLTGNGFINKVATTTGNVNISDITLQTVSFVNQPVEKSGLLIGEVATQETGTTNITGVKVEGTVLGTADAHDLGGLIGAVTSGTVNIKATDVKAEIEGYYNLGGIVGNIDANSTVTLGTDRDTEEDLVTVADGSSIMVTHEFTNDRDSYAGQVGIVAGQFGSKSTLTINYFKFKGNWATVVSKMDTDWRYDQRRFYNSENNEMVFKGCLNNGTKTPYVGYSQNGGTFKLMVAGNTLKSMVKATAGTPKAKYTEPTGGYAYNVFEQDVKH